MVKQPPVLLIIRDGWGENHNDAHDNFNAVKLANTPVADGLKSCPRTEIHACGLDVGLPEGIMGNSEVGHQNIGAGRITNQEIVRIDKAFASGFINNNPVLKKAFETKGALHLMGLASDAGVHSILEHLYSILNLAKEANVNQVFIHAFTDGRDRPPKSGLAYIQQIESHCKKIGIGKIASICGRFWAMDRDNRWNRVEKAYNCLIGKTAEYKATKASELIEEYYNNPLDETRNGDEFITPRWIVDENGNPIAPIKDGDSVLFLNFRGDRPREITRAFINDDFSEFDRGSKKEIYFATLTDYQSGLCPNVVFERPEKMKNILGQVVSDAGLKQFRCAETEKYPHVTFFFNDYREEPFPGEAWELVPSPKDVPTYDLKPEMSAGGVCKATKEAILSNEYSLIVVNFANPDMVGHTGSLKAAIKAVETVDACVGELLEALDSVKGSAIITADHGNADQMWNAEADSPHTQHTLNPVEVILYGRDGELKGGGRLADIAPTILQLMHMDQPAEMTGESLIR